MRKTLLLLFVAITTLAAKAQVEPGTFSIMPKVGMNISKLTSSEFYVGTVNSIDMLKSRLRVGVAAGVEVDYRMLDMLSLSAAAIYSQQGCKYKDEEYLLKDLRTKLDYINVPIMANVYLMPGFAVKAGVQFGWAISKSVKGNLWSTVINEETGQAKEGYVMHEFTDLNETLRDFDFSIPVGVAFDIDDVNIDLRYNFGLYDTSSKSAGMKNRVIQLTIGYRIAL